MLSSKSWVAKVEVETNILILHLAILWRKGFNWKVETEKYFDKFNGTRELANCNPSRLQVMHTYVLETLSKF
jgi:hypothetical protein